MTKTDTPARFTLNVWNAEENYYAVRQSDLPRTTSWGADFLDLEADTTYQAVVSAEDADGHVSQASGTFTTLRRFVNVDFGAFPFDGQASCCQGFDFYFSVDSVWQPHLEEWNNGPLFATLPGVRSVTVEDAPQWLPLRVQVVQRIPADFCEPAIFPKSALSGTSMCQTWQTAHQGLYGVNLDDKPADATSWTEWTRQVHLTTEPSEPADSFYSPLDFTVTVTVKVWFEPAD